MTAPRIGVCDYGVGNLRSVERAITACGAVAAVSEDADALDACDGLVLPGVGAFAPAAERLRDAGLASLARSFAASGRPLLGVCLGHQLLFGDSDEGDGGHGLALLGGRVARLEGAGVKVPHVGWNTLRIVRGSALLEGIPDGAYAYFVHSYAAAGCDAEDVVAVTRHGSDFAAVVERGNVMGTQFHPEKSGPVGLRIYANFAALCGVPAGAR